MPLSVAVCLATLRLGRKSFSSITGRIYNICYRFSGSADDASDLAQEVFIKMYRTLSTFDTTRASFMTWVTTVTRNLLVDHFRKGKYDRITDSLDATPGQPGGWPHVC